MGSGSSKSVKKSPTKRGASHHHGHSQQKSSWSQAHMVSSKPVAPTNLNVNHSLETALSSSNGQYNHNSPSASSSSTHRSHKPAALPRTTGPVKAVQINRNHNARKNQPKSTNGSAMNSTKASYDRNKECGVCGHTGHRADRCNHRDKTCNICHTSGHLASVCKQKNHHPDSRFRPRIAIK